jgi:hypothetical protein
MKEKLLKSFGYVMFYTMALGSCMLLGALAYTGISKVAPVPEGLPTALPTSGPSPTQTPTITPIPTITQTSTPAPFPIEIRNRTGDETVGERLAALLSDGGYNVVKISTGSTKDDFGDPFRSFRLWTPELTGPEVSLARGICSFLDIECRLWAGSTGDADVMIEVGNIHDWDVWLSERGY